MLEVDVVPTVATTQKGTTPLAVSSVIASASARGSIRKSESAGIFLSDRWPSPNVMIPFSIDECACSEA